MDVLYLQSYPQWTSMTTVHVTLIEGLAASGVRMHVACPSSTDPLVPGTLERLAARGHPHLFPFRFLPGRSALRRLRLLETSVELALLPRRFAKFLKYVRDNAIRIIHVPTQVRDITNGMILSMLSGIPLVIHQHLHFQDWFRPMVKLGFRTSAGVTAVSRATLQTAVEKGGVDARRGFVVPNAIDLTTFKPNPERASEVRQSLGVPAGAPLIGMVGRTVELKGHDRLIAAMDLVRRKVPNAHMVFVGEPDSSDPGSVAYAQKMQDEIVRRGLEGTVRFVGPRTDIPDVLAAIDLFAMPSRGEAFGLVYLEAMAAGRPIVGEASGGTLESTEDGVSSILVPPDDIESLADALTRVLLDPALGSRMGAAGRARVEERFLPHHAGAAMRDAFMQIVAQNGPPKRS